MANELEKEADQLDLEKEAILQHCLGKLKKDQKDALYLMYQKNTETDALAEKFGKSVTAFYQWVYRIRQKLSQCAKEVTQKLTLQFNMKKEEEIINRYLDQGLNPEELEELDQLLQKKILC